MNIHTISKILSTQGTILNKGEDEDLLNQLACLNINEVIENYDSFSEIIDKLRYSLQENFILMQHVNAKPLVTFLKANLKNITNISIQEDFEFLIQEFDYHNEDSLNAKRI